MVVQARNSISSQDQTYMKGSFQTPNAAEKIIVIIISSFSVCQKDKLKRIFHLFFARVIISSQDSFKAQRLRNKDFPTAAKIFILRAAEWVNVENTVYSSIGQTTDFYTLPCPVVIHGAKRKRNDFAQWYFWNTRNRLLQSITELPLFYSISRFCGYPSLRKLNT